MGSERKWGQACILVNFMMSRRSSHKRTSFSALTMSFLAPQLKVVTSRPINLASSVMVHPSVSSVTHAVIARSLDARCEFSRNSFSVSRKNDIRPTLLHQFPYAAPVWHRFQPIPARKRYRHPICGCQCLCRRGTRGRCPSPNPSSANSRNFPQAISFRVPKADSVRSGRAMESSLAHNRRGGCSIGNQEDQWSFPHAPG